MAKKVFVFGSNEAGMHGGGAAKYAYEKKGARYGKSYGHHGDSFAIPTMDSQMETLNLSHIQLYIYGFLAYAKGKHRVKFEVSRIGCGIAGLKDEDIAPLFVGAGRNILFDEEWRQYLGDDYQYWGTY